MLCTIIPHTRARAILIEEVVRKYLNFIIFLIILTHISLASSVRDIGKQNSPRCDAAKRGVASGAILFAFMSIIGKWNKHENIPLVPLWKWTSRWAATWENRIFAYAKTKTQISFAVTAKLISVFVFATQIVQSLFFPNPKFQVSSYNQWLRSPVCVGPGRKPRRPVFWRRGSDNKDGKIHSSQVGYM